MMTVLITPHEMAIQLSKAVKTKRLSLNFSQKTLSERSDVSFSVIKKFESTGKISLESLLKIALALNSLTAFSDLFKPIAPTKLTSLDELLNDPTRKRGRR